ncbi:MAG TPA: ABC transporter permease subunit, partial [Anaerolineaceae bacterium]|nr:ABC transporter permease subunit [Anaerolineaceae bacterium]
MKTGDRLASRNLAGFLRDERFLRVLGQVIFLILVGALLVYLADNMLSNMRRQGLSLSFSFLRLTSGFDIGEALIDHQRSDSFARAFLVGLLNTLLVSALGIVLATVLGVFFGIARLSTNFLVRQIARTYIEFLRNIPLLVFLIFLYVGAFIKLPRVSNAITLPGPVYLSNRGLAIPGGIPSETFPAYTMILAGGLLLAVAVAFALTRYGKRTGRTPLIIPWSLLAVALTAVLGWLLLPVPPLNPDPPVVQGLRVSGGLQYTPEFMALLTGLSVYTSAFIADVVRAGIQAVPRGQVEAAKSLGLTSFLILRLIVLPQALRVIVPPLTSQYLNLIKNSSLAVAIGYPELFHVTGTILNQSG